MRSCPAFTWEYCFCRMAFIALPAVCFDYVFVGIFDLIFAVLGFNQHHMRISVVQFAAAIDPRAMDTNGHFDRWRALLKWPGNTSADSVGRDSRRRTVLRNDLLHGHGFGTWYWLNVGVVEVRVNLCKFRAKKQHLGGVVNPKQGNDK